MVEFLNIDYKEEIPDKFSYIKRGRKQLLPKEIRFKEGLNIIVGVNGSGKSTLINILRDLLMCKFPKTFLSTGIVFELEDFIKLFYPRFSFYLFKEDLEWKGVKSCFSLCANYKIPTLYFKNILSKDENEILSQVKIFSDFLFSKNLSKGQSICLSLLRSFENLKNENNCSPLEIIFKLKSKHNLWKTELELLENKINDFSKIENKTPTILLDEPDAHLDIYNLESLFEMFSKLKGVQIICSIHNPSLIYKFSKNKNVNFIELTRGYKNRIKNFINEKE